MKMRYRQRMTEGMAATCVPNCMFCREEHEGSRSNRSTNSASGKSVGKLGNLRMASRGEGRGEE